MLLVDAPPSKKGRGYSAAAVFHKIDGEWQIVRAAPVLNWMMHQTAANIGKWLKGPARRYSKITYQWVRCDDE